MHNNIAINISAYHVTYPIQHLTIGVIRGRTACTTVVIIIIRTTLIIMII